MHHVNITRIATGSYPLSILSTHREPECRHTGHLTSRHSAPRVREAANSFHHLEKLSSARTLPSRQFGTIIQHATRAPTAAEAETTPIQPSSHAIPRSRGPLLSRRRILQNQARNKTAQIHYDRFILESLVLEIDPTAQNLSPETPRGLSAVSSGRLRLRVGGRIVWL